MSRKRSHVESCAGGFELTALGCVRIRGKLGEGGRSTVYDAVWREREVALKVYKPKAIERHGRRHYHSLAEFEYRRNLDSYSAPGLATYVAEPLGYLHTSGVSAFVQEKLEGELYYFFYRRREARVPPELFRHVERMVELHHRAGLYDVDLHSMNVMVVQSADGEPIPKLFDFNLMPFYARPHNVLGRLAMRLGLISRRSRDLRKLRHFHDFERVETKLLRFYR